MKTSKVIFISYFTCIAIILLSLPIGGYIFRKSIPERWKHETIENTLEPFKHIVVAGDCRIQVSSSGQNKYSYQKRQGFTKLPLNFRVTNDTLYITSIQDGTAVSAKVEATRVQSIQAVNSDIELLSFEQPTVAILGTKANIRFLEKVNIQSLRLSLSGQSEFIGWGSTIDELNIDIQNSSFEESLPVSLNY